MDSTSIPISYFLLFLFMIILLSLKFKLKTKTKCPPSPPKLPIIGNLHQLGPLPHQSLASLSLKHGPIMLLKLGQTPTLIISSARLAKQVMKTHDPLFSNRAQNTAAKALFYNCRDVSFARYGEPWRQARKLCFAELLSPKRVESFQHVRDQEVEVLVDIIGKACGVGGVVNLKQLLLSTANNIASRCILGEKFEDENGISRFGVVTRKVMVLLSAFCVGDVLPWLWWVDALRGFYGELRSTFEIMDLLFDEVIEEHKVKMKSGELGYDHKMDFVEIMLGLQQDHTLEYPFTMDDFKAILLDMFVGGTVTTATSLEWTMAELMRNPTAMKKAQQEVRNIVGQKRQNIQPQDIKKMEYMHCVMKESLRLHPPIPLLLPRETSTDVTLEGFEIRSKTSVWINAWAIQRDPEMWRRPSEFIPERFMEEAKSVEFKGQDFELVPFGSGRRHCVGMGFGVASFECVLANLLCWFDWKLLDGEMLDMAEEQGLSVFKKLPLQLVPIPPPSL